MDETSLKISKNSTFVQKTFPCKKCGASLVFSPNVQTLKCNYCGYENEIEDISLEIKECNLNDALMEVQNAPRVDNTKKEIKCPSCAASFEVDPHLRSIKCPFCETPIVTNMDIFEPLAPKSLLPFKIDQKEAKAIFRKWVGNLWFAPNQLKKLTTEGERFKGIYIPYWTYDSDTVSSYSGLRGNTYYVTTYQTVYVNGRARQKRVQVPKIKWTPVSGKIQRHFDDVLIGATKTIPRKLADSLQPWDLGELVPYNEQYLSGFESEIYQVELDEGFTYAQNFMEYVIRDSIRHEIGGDRQQITGLKIYHHNTTFKYLLLPIWTASFDYKNKTYRFAINARTGVIKGERPYSNFKIFAAISVAAVVLLIFFFAAEMSNQGY